MAKKARKTSGITSEIGKVFKAGLKDAKRRGHTISQGAKKSSKLIYKI